MENMLEWRHCAPTAPDTLDIYPFFMTDPFVMENAPSVFFAGNQPEFGTSLVDGPDGHKVSSDLARDMPKPTNRPTSPPTDPSNLPRDRQGARRVSATLLSQWHRGAARSRDPRLRSDQALGSSRGLIMERATPTEVETTSGVASVSGWRAGFEVGRWK